MAVKDWFKLKRYAHIGLPLKHSDRKWVVPYVTNPEKIKVHRFVPFLKRTIIQRKHRAAPTEMQKDGKMAHSKNMYGKRVRVTMEPPKTRRIYYANHLDSLIYSYYSCVLSNHYEWYIGQKPYNRCSVAYRKIRKTDGRKGNKSNIEFAYDAFDAMNKMGVSEISVIVADISNFFEELDHKILHQQWKRVLNRRDDQGALCMPDDHFNVFRSLTKKRFVELHELHNACYKSMWVKRCLPHNPEKEQWKQKKVARQKNFRREGVIAFCTKEEFFEKHLHLVRSERRGNSGDGSFKSSYSPKGIPQGSPMSAVLANIYMLDFDEKLYNYTKDKGFYQRYSDDLIVVCAREDESATLDFLRNEVAHPQRCKLVIHPEKTKLYRYEKIDGHFVGGIADPTSDGYNPSRQLEYLGFEYTGSRVFVKTQGISKYYRSMLRSIKRGKYYAAKAHHSAKGLFKNKLIKRFTILGGKRVLRRIPDPKNPNKFLPDPEKRYNWGNYFSYLLKADSVMKQLNNGENVIKRQTRRFERNFHRALKHPRTKLKQRTPRE